VLEFYRRLGPKSGLWLRVRTVSYRPSTGRGASLNPCVWCVIGRLLSATGRYRLRFDKAEVAGSSPASSTWYLQGIPAIAVIEGLKGASSARPADLFDEPSVRPTDVLAGLPNGLSRGDAGLGFQLSHRPRVVPRQRGDRVAGLLGNVGQAVPFPEQ
jgi:hypothetical protein